MGANHSLAQNVANQATDINNSILESYINNCGTTIDNNATFAANNCGDYEANNVNIKTDVIFDQTCVQNIKSNAQMTNDLTQAAKQAAESIAKGMGVNSADSANFSDQFIKLSNQLQQNFSNECAGKLINNFSATCTDTNRFILNNITIDTNVKSAVDCAQNIQATEDFVNNISQAVDQSAIAKAIGPSFDAMLIFFIVLAIAACFILYYGEQFMVYLIIILVVVAILVVIGFVIYLKVSTKHRSQ